MSDQNEWLIKRIINKHRVSIIVLVAYTVLSIIFTYPVVISLTKIPGHGDAFWYLWDFWWFKTALLSFANPYYSPYIFHPIGGSLAFSGITPLNAIASIPLQLVFGLITAYKIIWISTFILSGFGTFLLVRYLTGDTRAAFIAGLIFMFCPYRFAHALGHMNLISTQWIPFYVLFLIKTTDEKRISNALFAALFLFLTAISCYYYLIYLCVFTLLYLLYLQLSDKRLLNKELLKRFTVIVIPFGVLVSPFIYPILKELITAKSNYMYSGGFVTYSADLIGFFIPSTFHPYFKDIVAPIYINFTGNIGEYTVFAGYTVILLSILAIIKIKTKKVNFWAFSAIIFSILCMGPILHVNGIFSILCEGYTLYIPLPYAILMHIPVFSMARVPSRWDVLVMLSLAVLAGYGLCYIFNMCRNKFFVNISIINILSITVSCLILFEFLAVPYPMSAAEVPPFYEQIANEEGDYSILEIPNIVPTITHPEFMYYQTIHGKKLINGYASRTPDYVMTFVSSTPLISHLIFLSNEAVYDDILHQNLTRVGSSILNYYNIRYIILHKDRMTAEQLDFASSLLRRTIDEEPVIYEPDSMIVFKVRKETIKPFMALTEGWHGLEDWSGTPSRWMSDDATLMIHSDENRTADLSLQALSFYRPRTLEIYVNDLSQIWAEVPTEGFVMVNVPISLNKGANLVRFHVLEGCERPCDIPELKNKDERGLSLVVQNITLT